MKIQNIIANWFLDRTPDAREVFWGEKDLICYQELKPRDKEGNLLSFRAIVTAYFVENYKAYKSLGSKWHSCRTVASNRANKKSLPKPPNWN